MYALAVYFGESVYQRLTSKDRNIRKGKLSMVANRAVWGLIRLKEYNII